MLWVALLVVLLFLSATAWVLDRAFYQSIENSAQSQLQLQVYSLLTAADEDFSGALSLPERLQEPRFNNLNSGLYGWIVSSQGEVLWQSHSSLGESLTIKPSVKPGEPVFELDKSTREPRYQLAFAVVWQGVGDVENTYTFMVSEQASLYRSQLKGFRRVMWVWLSALGIILLLVLFLVITWGLRPLETMSQNVRRIEKGESDRLEGRYPKELAGVVQNLNVLIDHERHQRERYKNSLGDLAHSLKTPLAVVKGSLNQTQDPEALRALINEQTTRMDDIVAYQLRRAIASAPVNLVHRVPAFDLVDRIAGALQKVYCDKAVNFANDLPPHVVLTGDESDFYEVFGNVLDNAFKHCSSSVRIALGEHSDMDDNGRLLLCFVLDDDGKGIPVEQRESVMTRGIRVDESVPGQGIGLSVVNDIINRYGGALSIAESPTQGARLMIRLPGMLD